MTKIIGIFLVLLIIINPAVAGDSWTPETSIKGVFNKIKDKYFAWVPSWQEVAFLVNIVSIYSKVRDNYYKITYQIRLVQSTIRLVERQYQWIKRTQGMIKEMSERGFSLYDIEMTFRDAAYLTGPNYAYGLYLSGRITKNINTLISSVNQSPEEFFAINGVCIGNPNTRAMKDLSDGSKIKLPDIYQADLYQITRADQLIRFGNSNLDSVNRDRKDIISKMYPTALDTINISKVVQQLCMLQLKRTKLKTMEIDMMMERNRTIAHRILTKSYLLKQEKINNKYNSANQVMTFGAL